MMLKHFQFNKKAFQNEMFIDILNEEKFKHIGLEDIGTCIQ